MKPILQKEQVLSKPQLYLGITREVKQQVWIIQNGKATLKSIFYVPAILKIYDELLTNAAQHKMRDDSTSFIQITVKDNGVVTIANDGKSLPLDRINQNTYIIQSIFGQSQQNSQFYRTAYSVKLVNIFSKHFFVQTGNKNKQIAIKIDWRNNMFQMDAPQTRPYNKIDYTKISAALDLHKFGVKKLSADFIGLLQRRAYDIAGLNRLRICFNQKQISFTSLSQYAQIFTKSPSEVYCDTDNKSPRWKVILLKSTNFQQISFVNSCIWTKNGGTHVNFVISQIATRALQLQRKKLRDPLQVMNNPQKFKSNYMLIISIYIQNPSFNSVNKDALITPISKFQSLYQLSQSALQFLQKNKQLQTYKQMAKQRDKQKVQKQIIRKTIKTKVNIPKLDDAYNAGISTRCTLIIAENDSVRQVVYAGLEWMNRDYFGIYTTKNKLVNARQINSKQMSENIDYSSIVKALGLTIGKTYENVEQLRYSSVLLVSDNGLQGISFKGLLINFFDTFWPSLLKCKGFVKLFIMPVVRCINSEGNIKQFFTHKEFQSWSSMNLAIQQWNINFYPNITSMNSFQIKQIFSQRKKYCFTLTYQSMLDEDSLQTVYNKKQNEAKKKLLQQYNPQSIFEYNTNIKTISIKDFVDKKLIHCFYHQYQQIIPSSIDGLNKLQRRVMHCLLQIGIAKEIRVHQLSGIILEKFPSYCNDVVIQNSIISLGQCYTGGNNMNLIEPIGRFGSRVMNGKDCAPSKYLLTSLPTLTRLLFPQEDQQILQYDMEDGLQKQPKYYVPIIPLLLINGYNGNDNLWNSIIHPHKVNDIIDLIKERIVRESSFFPNIYPWWEGFKGSVNSQKKGVYQVKGKYQIRTNNTIIVTQIPPNKSYKQYKSFLQSKTTENSQQIDSIKQQQRGQKLNFIIKFHLAKMPPQCQLDRYLKITSNLQEAPMTLIHYHGSFKKYQNLSQILQEFYQVRLKLYEIRRDCLISRFIRNIQILSQKIRFIKDILNGEFNLSQSEQTWKNIFTNNSYIKYQHFHKVNLTKYTQQQFIDFQYLLKLTINDFSQRKINQLQSEKEECSNKLNQLRNITSKQMWIKQINLFEESWKQFNRKRDHQLHQSIRKTQNLYKQEPSQESVKKKSSKAEVSQISLDSQVRAQLEKHLENTLNQSKKIIPPLINNKNAQSKQYLLSKDQSIRTQADTKIQRKQFDQMIQEMEKANYQFQQRMKKEAEINRRKETMDKLRHRQVQKIKRDKDLKEKEQKVFLQAKQNEKIKEDKAIVQKEANNRREALGRHAKQLGKKVEQQKRRQQQQKEKSQKSQRNHLPQPSTPTPRITVPFKCDSTTFQVNHVQRKRFPSRGLKNDQVDLNKIAAELRKKQQQQQIKQQLRNNRINTCIDLDAD